MPLRKGKSKKVIGGNIREMVREYTKGDGKIGNVRPESKKHAVKIAVAAAMKKAGKAKRKGRK